MNGNAGVPLGFEIRARDRGTRARLGVLRLPHGELETPAFMAVGTQGAVKALSMPQVAETGTPIVLGNTYHLHLRPGEDIVAAAGGLHKFSGWSRPMLTDSGGFQVFSLATLNHVDDAGVRFRSHIDGHEIYLDAERSIAIQNALGADIIMAFDECPPFPAAREDVERAVQRTIAWARRSKDAHRRPHDQALFGIVQGGIHADLRRSCAAALRELDLPGYAIGGLSVGESPTLMAETLEHAVPWLPDEKPRYLMGVGPPRDIVRAVAQGIDLFDCVLPTRNARNGSLFTWEGVLKLRNASFRTDFRPLDAECPCEPCHAGLSRAYLAHLSRARELSFFMFATQHNLTFFQQLMARIRTAINEDRLGPLVAENERRFP